MIAVLYCSISQCKLYLLFISVCVCISFYRYINPGEHNVLHISRGTWPQQLIWFHILCLQKNRKILINKKNLHICQITNNRNCSLYEMYHLLTSRSSHNIQTSRSRLSQYTQYFIVHYTQWESILLKYYSTQKITPHTVNIYSSIKVDFYLIKQDNAALRLFISYII